MDDPVYRAAYRRHVEDLLATVFVPSRVTATIKGRSNAASRDAPPWNYVANHCDRTLAIGAARLVPCLSIGLLRVTLVGAAFNERVTLDWDLEVRDRGVSQRVSNVVIAEIKQARHSNTNRAVRVFRMLGVREHVLSKYCLATARLAPVRMNTFKPAFRTLERYF